MLVPEASVNKDHLPAGSKDKVWFSGEVFAVQSESVAQPVEHPAQQKLRCRIL